MEAHLVAKNAEIDRCRNGVVCLMFSKGRCCWWPRGGKYAEPDDFEDDRDTEEFRKDPK